ncbi:MAG: carboxypeptidase regulatory-like domain-containing protein [Blastocatellia bacterium]
MSLWKTFGRTVVLLLAALPALAQGLTGQISGTVRDATGGRLPGATITVLNEQTQFQRAAVSDDGGYYVLTNLPPGQYRVAIEHAGFKVFVKNGVQLNAGDRVAVEPELEIGAVTEAVTVSAAGENVETESPTVGQIVDGSQMRELALNGRNPMQLLMLIPGVAMTTDEFDRGGFTYGSVGSINVNGLRSTSLSVTIDGGYNQDSGNITTISNNVGVDFISEVKVSSSTYSAEHGRFGGAQINFATRRGGKQYHGTLLEFFRNEKMNARSYFSPVTEKLRLNNFGWNLGGPVYWPGKFNSNKRKLFFFGGQEYKRRIDGDTRRATLPTRAERAGTFNTTLNLRYPVNFPVVALRGQVVADPTQATAANPTGRNILPKEYITANGAALMRIYDAMEKQAIVYNDVAGANNTTFQLANSDFRRQDLARVDYTPSDRNQFTLRYLFDIGDNSNPYERGALPTYRARRHNEARNFQFSWTHVLNARTTNEFAAVTNYLFLERFPYDEFASTKTYGLNLKELFGNEMDTLGIPQVAITNYTTLFGARGNSHSPFWDGSIRDNFTHVRGRHQLKTGFMYIRDRKNERIGGTGNLLPGSLTFSTGGNTNTSNNALLDVLLGNYRQYQESDTDKFSYIRFNQFEAYLGDAWKPRRNLTLDVGFRFAWLGAPTEKDDTLGTFVPSAYDPAKAQQVIPTGANQGELRPGIGVAFNGVVPAGTKYLNPLRAPNDPAAANLFRNLPRGLMNSQAKWSPRVGFAWDPFGKQRFVVRGGAAIYYDRLALIAVTAGGNPPFAKTVTLFNGTLDELGKGRAAEFPISVNSINPSTTFPETYNWSLGFQKKLPFEALLDINYVSTQGRHLLRRPDINGVDPEVYARNTTSNLNALRPYSGYTNILLYESSASSSYHGLQMGLTRRYAKKLTLSASYTFSKAITDASANDATVEDTDDYDSERGHATFDRNHIFTASYVYDLPFPQRGKHWYNRAFGGWRLAGTVQAQMGAWLTPVVSTGIGTRRADLIGEIKYFDPRKVQSFIIPANPTGLAANYAFDPRHRIIAADGTITNPDAAFATPPANRYGSSGVGVIRGPGRHNWDMVLSKNTRLKEGAELQFRFEAYNVWNHVNFRNPNVTLSSRDFGTISDAGAPRLLQVAMKLIF